jgi:hypothetical protein
VGWLYQVADPFRDNTDGSTGGTTTFKKASMTEELWRAVPKLGMPVVMGYQILRDVFVSTRLSIPRFAMVLCYMSA